MSLPYRSLQRFSGPPPTLTGYPGLNSSGAHDHGDYFIQLTLSGLRHRKISSFWKLVKSSFQGRGKSSL